MLWAVEEEERWTRERCEGYSRSCVVACHTHYRMGPLVVCQLEIPQRSYCVVKPLSSFCFLWFHFLHEMIAHVLLLDNKNHTAMFVLQST